MERPAFGIGMYGGVGAGAMEGEIQAIDGVAKTRVEEDRLYSLVLAHNHDHHLRQLPQPRPGQHPTQKM